MGQNLNKEEIKKIIAEELNDLGDYNLSIKDIDVNIENSEVKVTFGLHTVDNDNYIGLCFY